MKIKEVELTKIIAEQLIIFSEEWEKENSCYGYRKNDLNDLENKRIFIAVEGDEIYGYLFGHHAITNKNTSIYEKDKKYFEVDELYIRPQYRNQGIGKQLFQHVEEQISAEVDLIMLTTATKNYRAILNFYIDELGMEFWSAALFKNIK